MSRPLGHSAAGRIKWMKNSIDTIGNLTPNSPARSRVPQPTAIPLLHIEYSVKLKVKWSRYRPGVAQWVGRGINLLFHDRGTRRGWVISSKPRPHFTPMKDPVPILQEAGWAPGPVWTGGKSCPHRDSIPDRPARSPVAIPTELPGPYSVKLLIQISEYTGYVHVLNLGV